MLRKSILVLMLATVLQAGGCRALGYLGYLLAPPEKQVEVPADYENLPGHSVAVVVFADQAVQFEYPSLRLELTSVVAGELRDKVKDVTVVDPLKVVRYQDQNIYWDSMDKTELGEKLEADYILLVSVVDFRSTEPVGSNAFRGRAVAEASLYKTSLPERRCRVRRYDDLRVTYPPEDAGPSSDGMANIRYMVQRQLAEKIVRKFYDHKVPASEVSS
ncbi:MAG: hypothetical protein ACP5HU_03425 [Phycisphaerae bacterium]